MGKILGAHGVKGLVKLASFTAAPEAVAAYGPLSDRVGAQTWTVKLHGFHKTHFVADLGLADRTAAEALKGTELFVARAKLPPAGPGEYYYADLIGLEARVAGQPFGRVVEVANYGAGDILYIAKPEGGTDLFPFSTAVVPAVDVDGGFLVLVPPEVSEAKGDADA